jgi:hypothetical protein
VLKPRLAKEVLRFAEQLAVNEKQLEELVQASEAAPLLQEKGFRTISAGKMSDGVVVPRPRSPQRQGSLHWPVSPEPDFLKQYRATSVQPRGFDRD